MAPLVLATISTLSLYYNMMIESPFDILPANATAYCIEGITKSGEYTRDGICAGKEEWIGKRILIFQKLPDGKIGEFIGEYEVKDTGGTDGLRNGTVVDIWKPDLESCQEFMNLVYEDNCYGKVYIIIEDP